MILQSTRDEARMKNKTRIVTDMSEFSFHSFEESAKHGRYLNLSTLTTFIQLIWEIDKFLSSFLYSFDFAGKKETNWLIMLIELMS